jgi:toxin ParE1/3/4
VAYRLVFRPEAKADILNLHDYIASHAGATVAAAYLDRLERACSHLTTFPERGTVRSELIPGIRIIGFERRTSIAFRVEGDVVEILRLLHGGQSIPDEWDAE